MLESGWISLASVATPLKLLFFTVASLATIACALVVLVRAERQQFAGEMSPAG